MELERLNDPELADARPPRSASALVSGIESPRSVRVNEPGSGASLSCELAVPGYSSPRVGDRVLYTTDDAGRCYVIGVLQAAAASPIDELFDAAEGRESGPVDVHDRRGRLLFEYDPSSDRAVLHVPEGDLHIDVPAGALHMSARDGVTLESEGEVRARSKRSIELEVNADTDVAARVRIQPGGVSLVGDVVTLAGRRAELIATRIAIRARTLDSHVDRVRQVARVIDTRATRIVERARDTYREVERLSQVRAGRLKWVAEKTASLVAENTLLKARDRMKIKGERIHLA